jgi:signal transduction histidine kinase
MAVLLAALACGASAARSDLRLGSAASSLDPHLHGAYVLDGDPGPASGWAALPDDRFRPLEPGAIRLSDGRRDFLLRLPVVAPVAGRWWIRVDCPGLDSFQAEAGGRARGWVGEAVPRSRWTSPWHASFVALDLAAGRNLVHLRCAGSRPWLRPQVRLRPDSLQETAVEDEGLLDGIFAGVVLANVFAGICLILVSRRSAMAWYTLFQLALAADLLSARHHLAAWLWPDLPLLDQALLASLLPATLGVAGMFLSGFLDLPALRPRLGRALRTGSVAFLVLAAAAPFLARWEPLSPLLVHDGHVERLVFAALTLGFALAIRRGWRGHKPSIRLQMLMIPMAVLVIACLAGEVYRHPMWMFPNRGNWVRVGLCLENLGLSMLLVHILLQERRVILVALERHLGLELEFSRQLAAETDRSLRGTALDLHDGIGQELVGMGLLLRGVFREAGRPDLADDVALRMRRMMGAVRTSAHRIYPPELTEGGIRHALERLADRVREEGNLHVSVSGDMPGLAETDSLHWYRIAQEAVANARRAGGSSRVELRLEPGRLRVVADGHGARNLVDEGLGLRGMRQRALLLGCEVHLDCDPEKGCVLEVVPGPARGRT